MASIFTNKTTELGYELSSTHDQHSEMLQSSAQIKGISEENANRNMKRTKFQF